MRTTRATHLFGDLLTQLRARKHGLTQSRLAELTGYDPAVIARMGQGQKDLTGPQARERVIRVIEALDAEGVLHSVKEANSLLEAAALPPLFAGNDAEEALLKQLALHQRNMPDAALPFVPRHNLPAQLTSFIGREQEIAQIKQLLSGPMPAGKPSRARVRSQARLVTLTGPGGVGKTRLALEVASSLLEAFADGVWWASLASLTEAAQIAQTILNTFELNRQTAGTPLSILASYLESRRLLLVLDNCEHLVDACAELVAHLMSYCPTLCILATSREALLVPGEVTLRVPPLTTPRPVTSEDTFLSDTNDFMDFDAVHLFVERAQATRPDFNLTAVNTAAVIHVCDRLDGIPLALELAAALLQVLSVEEIAARIDNRFTLLKGGYRTATPRHQALSNAVDWSYELLSPAEQILLARLSVFVGGWDAQAAEWVCADADARDAVLPALRQLVNKSLVVIDERPSHVTRYRLLKTIHEYAAEKLSERKETLMLKENHLAYYVRFAEAADAQLMTHEFTAAWAQLTAEQDNLRAALAEAEQAADAEALLRLVAALQHFWVGRGLREEGTRWMDKALALGHAAPARLRIAVMFAWSWTFPEDEPHLAALALRAEACLEECRAAQDQTGIAQSLTVLGGCLYASQKDFDTALAYLKEALSFFEARNDRRGVYILRHRIGYALQHHHKDFAAAESWMKDNIKHYRITGDTRHLSTALADLGWLMGERDPRDPRSVEVWRESVEAARTAGDDGLHSEFLLSLGYAELAAGDRVQAIEHFAQSLQMACDMDSKPGIEAIVEALREVDPARAEAILKAYLLRKQESGDVAGMASATHAFDLVHNGTGESE